LEAWKPGIWEAWNPGDWNPENRGAIITYDAVLFSRHGSLWLFVYF
jgi:hypothetical protein